MEWLRKLLRETNFLNSDGWLVSREFSVSFFKKQAFNATIEMPFE